MGSTSSVLTLDWERVRDDDGGLTRVSSEAGEVGKVGEVGEGGGTV